jgi:pimeloyl-ACP methyl ester carboxylesterase
MKHIPIGLKQDRRALGLLSKRPPSTAIVFVHGFWGKPRSTWVDFVNLIEKDEKWDNCDLFFYGHRSNKQVRPLADKLLPFLTELATRRESGVMTTPFIAPSSTSTTLFGTTADFWNTRGTSPYKQIVLVGHSAGALIIRETLCLAARSPEGGEDSKTELTAIDAMLLQSHVRFFAPAHRGLLGAGLLGIAKSVPMIDLVPALILEWNPLYKNIEKQMVVDDIKSETERLWKEHKYPALKALSVFGHNETIVNIGKYDHEDKEKTLDHQTHTSVCKPRPDFPFPVEFVADVI